MVSNNVTHVVWCFTLSHDNMEFISLLRYLRACHETALFIVKHAVSYGAIFTLHEFVNEFSSPLGSAFNLTYPWRSRAFMQG